MSIIIIIINYNTIKRYSIVTVFIILCLKNIINLFINIKLRFLRLNCFVTLKLHSMSGQII